MISICYANPWEWDETDRPAPLEKPTLTRRHEEVWALICEGKPNKIIAYELGCALATVKVHIAELMRRTQTTNRFELMKLARRDGRI